MHRFDMKWHHAGINVSDITRSIRWYRDILGFNYVAHDELRNGMQVAWLEYKGFYIELFEAPEIKRIDPELEYSSIGTRHICLCIDPGNFTILRDFLKVKGVPVVLEIDHTPDEVGNPDGLRCMFITDPDGIRIEFLEDFIPGSYGTNQPRDI